MTSGRKEPTPCPPTELPAPVEDEQEQPGGWEGWMKVLLWLAGTLMWMALPFKNMWMGDAYPFSNLLKDYTLAQIIGIPDGSFFVEPLSMLIYHWFGNPATTSLVFGVLWAVFLAMLINRDIKWAVLGLLPIIQVFAGYIEVYAPVYALSLGVVWAYITLKRESTVVLLWLLAFFAHTVIALPLLPLALRRLKWSERAVLMLFPVGYILFMRYTYPFRFGLATMDLTGPYSLFSEAHILEVLAYLGVIIVPWWLYVTWRSESFSAPLKKLGLKMWLHTDRAWLIIAAFLGLGQLLITCPTAGMLRYFDSMGGFVLPVAVAILYGVAEVNWRGFVATGLITLMFLVFNAGDRVGVMKAYMLWHPVYTAEFDEGHQRNVAAYIFQKELADTVTAVRLFHR